MTLFCYCCCWWSKCQISSPWKTPPPSKHEKERGPNNCKNFIGFFSALRIPMHKFDRQQRDLLLLSLFLLCYITTTMFTYGHSKSNMSLKIVFVLPLTIWNFYMTKWRRVQKTSHKCSQIVNFSLKISQELFICKYFFQVKNFFPASKWDWKECLLKML